MPYVRLYALSLTAFLLGTIAATAQSAPHHRYKLVVFGTLGGPQSFVDPASGNDIGGRARVINSQGAFAGFADTTIGDPFPYLCFWDDCLVVHAFQSGHSGALENLGALPGGGSSVAAWITDSGLIAGLSQNGETDPLYPGLPQPLPQVRAVLWEKGTITDLGVLPEGGYQSEANAVNSAGQVVGAVLNTVPDLTSMQTTTFASQPGTFWLAGGLNPPYQYQTRAFLWDRQDGMQDLDTLPGGTDAQALLINEKGQVVGHSYIGSTPSPACAYPLATDSFLWEKDKGMVDLGSLGGTCTLATDLNNHGQVVGESNFMGDTTSAAFLWERGQIHQLAGSLGGSSTGGLAVNEAGDTAGFANLPGDMTFHASMWKYKRGLIDLGVLSGDQCSYATAVNARGQIAGGSIANCTAQEPTFRAFLWERGTMYDLNTLIPANSPLYLEVVETINERGEIGGTGVDTTGNEHAYIIIPCDAEHADVEGCDYSMVDPATAPEVPAPRAQSPGGHKTIGLSRHRQMMLPMMLRQPGMSGTSRSNSAVHTKNSGVPQARRPPFPLRSSWRGNSRDDARTCLVFSEARAHCVTN